MHVVIIGAGAVGMLVASFLAEVNMKVTLVVRRQEQVECLTSEGLHRKNIDGSTTKVFVQATTDLQSITNAELYIIAVKYGQLQLLYKHLDGLAKEIPLLFVQNGLAHYDEVLLLSHQTLAFSSVSFGAEVESDACVLHRGHGKFKIAYARGEESQLKKLQKAANADFEIQWCENAERMLLEKAMLNTLINPLTAILQVKNGELIKRRNAYNLLQQIYSELMAAFPAYRELLPFNHVVALCEKTAANTSSMLVDRQRGRKSEIDTIVGAILERAERNAHTLPTLRTIYHQVLAIEESGESN
ncbi:MAG: 2-dehydropantoate 2-reductase [Lysinibacillus sp.]